MCVNAGGAGHSELISRTEKEIKSDLSELAGVREFVRRVCDASPLDDDATDQFELAMSETATNIMMHGYKGRTDGRIRILADTFTDRVVMRLYHWGVGFEPGPRELPRVDTYQEVYKLWTLNQAMRY